MENIRKRILDSAPFRDIFWAREFADELLTGRALITVKARVPPTQRVVLTGESVALGQWDVLKGVDMLCNRLPLWFYPVEGLELALGVQYKFVIMEGDSVVGWETGDNRVWDFDGECGEFRGVPEYRPKISGVAIPLFSIKSEDCEGIGDFVALGDFARWAAKAGQQVVQILPINDTTTTHTWHDSYPYSSISIFALHPLYIRVSEFFDGGDFANLERLDRVNYDQVDAKKWELFRAAYAAQGLQCMASDGFKEFFEKNEWWLKPYALFSHLRDRFSTARFSDWPAPYNEYDRASKADVGDLGLYYFLQYHADRQLRMARDVAHSVGVALKGDIPIGVCRDSVETWSEGQLFNMDGQAGAPPDEFSEQGQNWGFPTYNWDRMAEDNYSWWRRRFAKMEDYFDMYRIDHILGFFRIWEIPMPERRGVMGHFSPSLPFDRRELSDWGLPMCEERYLGFDDTDCNTLFVREPSDRKLYHPRIAAQSTSRYRDVLDDYERERFDTIYNHYFYERHNEFWKQGALAKLPPLIDSTKMLCCAEDLGMIPGCVSDTLTLLGIVTLEIQRMPKNQGVEFGVPANYPYMCVCTTSTHDMSPIRMWWTEDRAKTQRYYSNVMQREGEAPTEATPEICRSIVMEHLRSPAFATILPLSDWLSVDGDLRVSDGNTERINVPSNPNHCWDYRMKVASATLTVAPATLTSLF